MKEDENIVAHFQRVDEITNALEGLGEPIFKKVIIWKVLKTLMTRFNLKVFVLEDRSDLSSLSMDEVHGIITTYEMKIEEKKVSSNI